MVGRRQKNRHHRPSPIFQHLGDEAIFQKYAMYMRKHAKSWRGYLVGGSGIGVKSDGQYVLLSGFNTKVAPGPRRHGDKCAEMRIIENAKAERCVAILEMWCALEPKRDDATALNLGVTISCVHCRSYFRRELSTKHTPLKCDTKLNFIDSTKPERTRPFTVEQILRICS